MIKGTLAAFHAVAIVASLAALAAGVWAWFLPAYPLGYSVAWLSISSLLAVTAVVLNDWREQ